MTKQNVWRYWRYLKSKYGFVSLLAFLAAAAFACSVRAADEQQNLALDFSSWKRTELGNPPKLSLEASIQITGSPALRVTYAQLSPGWGSLYRDVALAPSGRAFFIRLYRHAAKAGAELMLKFTEPDGDEWEQPLLFDGKQLGQAADGWLETEAAVGMLKYLPKGDGKRGLVGAAKVEIVCRSGDLDMSITDFRLRLSGETPGESSASLPPPQPENGEKGRVAILAENFVTRKPDLPPVASATAEEKKAAEVGSPSISDPEWLAELARRAGYGATTLSASSLESPGYLSINNFDALIIPCAPYYPLKAAKAIQTFLASGGSLFTTGGYAFDKPCVRAGGQWHTAQQSLTVEEVDRDIKPVNLNHRFGIPEDGKGPEADQIPLFDPMNPLKNADYAESSVGFIPRVRVDGPFEGWAASALLGSNNPVFPKAHARWIPLLQGYDSIGRKAGTIGAIVHNFDGPYRRSSWAAFGVTNTDLFSRTGPLAIEFGKILDRVVHKIYLRSLETDLALYKPGEAARLSVTVCNFDKKPVKVCVRFEITSRDGLSVTKLDPVDRDIPAGFEDRVEIGWAVPNVTASDFYKVRCELSAGDFTDEMHAAFCIDNPKAREAGFPLEYKDNYFCHAGSPTFLLGTNQTGAIFHSAFENPLVWDIDLDSMRSQGLSIMRVLHFSPFVRSKDWHQAAPSELNVNQLPLKLERRLDALVQLCAAHKIVLLLTLHDWMDIELTDDELAAQKKWAALIAGRYASCPHVMYDIQNEPYIKCDSNGKVGALWNTYLKNKYGSSEALAAAWGSYLSGEKLGEIKPEGGAEAFDNLRSADFDGFRTWLLNRWLESNYKGVKEGSKAAVTLGYIQYPHFADHLLGSRWQDFTSSHYYGDKSVFARQIKLLDRSFEGKNFSVGEFGSVVDHDSRLQGITRQVADFDWFLQACGTTLGLGGAFILNWCWKEMPDNVFPWGVNTPCDNNPRETLLAFRAFAMASRVFSPAYSSPRVWLCAPDGIRAGSVRKAADTANYNSLDALLAQRVELGVINEQALHSLPKSAEVVVVPCPFQLSDEAYAKLKDFVNVGGTLYVSGDISFDNLRKRTRPERLKELFGLEFVSESIPPMTFAKGADNKPLPSVNLKPSGAEPLFDTGLFVNGFGKGKAVFNPVPAELAEAPAGVYGSLLHLAGVSPYSVDPADPNLLVYRVSGNSGDEAVFLHNRAQIAKSAVFPGGKTKILIKPEGKALVILKSGLPVSLIASGNVSIGGSEWMETGLDTAVVSLDGKPLDQSSRLALCPMGIGEIRIKMPSETDATAWVGEIRGGRWANLATRQLQRNGRLLILPAERSLAFSIILVAPKEQLEAASKQAARLIAFAD